MISIEFDTGVAQSVVNRWPRSMKQAMGDVIERVGRKMERDAKQYAPVVSGNLRRQIDFRRSGMTGEVRAKANYSAFVHGSPYHSGRGKTTPFFTQARDNNKRYAQREVEAVINKTLKVI
jgi:hypothetical protein